jgi:hypothetical protein
VAWSGWEPESQLPEVVSRGAAITGTASSTMTTAMTAIMISLKKYLPMLFQFVISRPETLSPG